MTVIFHDSSSGNFSKLDECPICNESRFKSESKNVPRKTFKYLPLETRIRRLFGNKPKSSFIQLHRNSAKDTQTVSSIHESPAWSEWYGSGGSYNSDPRALTFAICLDGLNPFKKENASYSMCPILLSPLNFPPHLRRLSGSMLLAGIIPGPKEPQNTDPYIELVTEEIIKLNNTEMYDAANDESFKLQVNVALYILDYPGQNKVFHCQGQCTYTCMLVYS